MTAAPQAFDASDLSRALAENQFFLVYQPKLSLKDHQITGMEALIRWKHPQHGVINPLDFIPTAETSGMIHPIGRWVVQESLRTLQYLKQLKSGLRMSFNVSPIQLSDPHFYHWLNEWNQEFKREMPFMEMEITENTPLPTMELVQKNLKGFRKAGTRVSLDDYGTGYSVMERVGTLNPDVIKIDRSLVQAQEYDPQATEVICAVAAWAHLRGIEVCAEGVETQQQLHTLKALGCTTIQGFYFSKPLTLDALIDFLALHPQGGTEDESFVQ